MSRITPFLWFDGQVEEAVEYYLSIFPRASLTSIKRNGPGGPHPEGAVVVAQFRLCDQPFVALNGGSHFSFSPALSLFVECDSQEESDRLFDALAAEGKTLSCGWVTDKLGVTWQIVPPGMLELTMGDDAERSGRAMAAMMNQIRLNVAEVRAAYDGDSA